MTSISGLNQSKLQAKEELNKSYGEHMLEYEQTKLRPIFEEEIGNLVLEWSQVRQQSIRQAGFALAIKWCDSPFTLIVESGFGWRGI